MGCCCVYTHSLNVETGTAVCAPAHNEPPNNLVVFKKTGTFGQPELFDPILTRHFLQYARRAHARISSSWHACMNEPASMTRHACCCCCCWLLCSSQQQLLAAAAAASSSQQQPAASSAQHPAWLLRGHAVASKPGCMLHGMSCCFKTGMHAAWHELLLQNRDACCMA